MSRRSRIVSFGLALALVVGGALGAVFVGGEIGQLLAFVLIALGFVLATSLVFLEVGLSEDRELARERRSRERRVVRRARRPIERARSHRRQL